MFLFWKLGQAQYATILVSMVELYENLDTLVAMNSISLNFNGGFGQYKGIIIMKNLFPIDYVILKKLIQFTTDYTSEQYMGWKEDY